MQSRALNELPLFKELKEELIKKPEINRVTNHNATVPLRNGQGRTNEPFVNAEAQVRHDYIPPLSAFSAYKSGPDSMANVSNNELYNILKRDQKWRESIRGLGKDIFRPIGINRTMEELITEARPKSEYVEEQPQFYEEPGNHAIISIENDNSANATDTHGYHLAEGSNDAGDDYEEGGGGEGEGEEVEEEQEMSYNYSEEYTRSEEEHANDIDIPEEQEENQEWTKNTSNARALSINEIAHYVEQSYIQNNNPYIDQDAFEEELSYMESSNYDFTEVPSLTISDPIVSSDRPRVSSLNNRVLPS